MTDIQNPSFEEEIDAVTDWEYVTNNPSEFSGERTTDWSVDGDYSYKISYSTASTTANKYAHIKQQITITEPKLYLFARWQVGATNATRISVKFGGNVIWTKVPQSNSTPTTEEIEIDVSAYIGQVGDLVLELKATTTNPLAFSAWVMFDRVSDAPYIEPPTISNISWSPAGDFQKLPSGASLAGSTDDLYLIGTDPGAFTNPGFSDGEALLRIGTGGAMFAVAEGDHFRFDDMEWWILNIVCGPECSFITLADENAEAARTPKLGDEIQFSCNVDWHGEDPDEVRWYYAKTPNRCFDEGDVSWTLFANEQFPLHIFEDDTDTDIVFIKAWARNKAGEIGELGDTCEPVFNLWAYHPSWWDSLLESIQSVNEEIAAPITNLFAYSPLEGWTEPPFTCPICKQVFNEEGSELEYAKHLMSHIKAFETGWFSTRFTEWATLEPQLENGSIGAQWWHLSDADRQQIATLAIANTEPNIAFGYLRTGKPNCEGGEGSWSTAQCGANAIVRYWKFGEDTPDGYHVYWSYDKIEEHCYVPEKPYDLPCFRVVAAKTDFGHEMAALQIGADPSTLDSWRIFQYGQYNIKTGDTQMPYGCHIEISKYFGDIIAEFDI